MKKIYILFFVIFSLNIQAQTWSALGTGISVGAPEVFAIAGYNGNIYAAGNFTMAGGISASKIAKWNGTSWSAAGVGILRPLQNIFNKKS